MVGDRLRGFLKRRDNQMKKDAYFEAFDKMAELVEIQDDYPHPSRVTVSDDEFMVTGLQPDQSIQMRVDRIMEFMAEDIKPALLLALLDNIDVAVVDIRATDDDGELGKAYMVPVPEEE